MTSPPPVAGNGTEGTAGAKGGPEPRPGGVAGVAETYLGRCLRMVVGEEGGGGRAASRRRPSGGSVGEEAYLGRRRRGR